MAQTSLPKHKVYLVVDDFETMRKVTVNQLQQLGAETILVAKNGQEALNLIRSRRVDMVVSDWNMPVMTGIDLLKAVRADSASAIASMPFVMVTAEADRTRITEAISNGVSAMLIKPYSPDQLAVRLEKALVEKPRQPARPVPNEEPAPAPGAQAAETNPSNAPDRPTVLCVDDTADNLTLLHGLLQADYNIRSVRDGAKALEICCADNPPDLVLLDVMMPAMDGFEVARRMREHPNAQTIPVIFVTAVTAQDAHAKGVDLGAVDFITKPIDPAMLKSRVRNFMRHVEFRRNLQADCDSMVELARLQGEVEQITRHDVKGPIAGMVGVLQSMLQQPDVPDAMRQQLQLLEETALQSLNLINLSSELYKIETGGFTLDARPVPLAEILQRTLELSRNTFADKQLAVDLVAEKQADGQALQALGDPTLCYSIFQNLLRNACEAAPPQGQVAVRLLNRQPLAVVIRNARAVPLAVRETFFDKYATAGKPGGTGLGTYSARLLCQAQNGSVSMETSDERDTTTLTLLLPRFDPPAA